MAPRKASRTAANSGVNSRVSMGAMLPATVLPDLGQPGGDDDGPHGPQGSSNGPSHSTSRPMPANSIPVTPVSTPPPRAMST